MTKRLHSLLESRLAEYDARSDQDILNAAKEIVQELALLGLARVGIFKKALFHGGTALRLLYAGNRFSEDLDLCLLEPDPSFSFAHITRPLSEELAAWGMLVEVVDKSQLSSNMRKVFLKEASLGAMLNLSTPLQNQQKLSIKLELDINPPAGGTYENRLLQFPIDFYVLGHDLASMFAGKLHAILCRGYLKGRDWHDLMHYISIKAPINYTYLYNSLAQNGPYVSNLPQAISGQWVFKEVNRQIEKLNFINLKSDIAPFLNDARQIEIWSKDYFLDKLASCAALM